MDRLLMALMAVLLLSACSQMEPSVLHTQARVSEQLNAQQYEILMTFMGENKDQQVANDQVNHQVEAVLSWLGQKNIAVHTMQRSLQPLYHYPEHAPRKLQGYQASQQLKVDKLKPEQYQTLMQELAQFNPHGLELGQVTADTVKAQQSLTHLQERAFNQAKQQAQQLAQLSELCELSVKEMRVYQEGARMPLMRMEVKAAMAPAKQNLGVRVEVSWWATPC